MREILFRGKREDNGKWVYGDLRHGGYVGADKTVYIVCADYALHNIPVIPETVGQYTGLKDENGRKIFEGDIAMYVDDFCEIIYREDDAMFYAKFDNVLESFGNISSTWLDVIGNIHEQEVQ